MAYLLQILVVVISLRIKLGANKQITQLAFCTRWLALNKKTFVSATMCPQQCVLVCQGLKFRMRCHNYWSRFKNFHVLHLIQKQELWKSNHNLNAMHSGKSDEFVNSYSLLYILFTSWLCCCSLATLCKICLSFILRSNCCLQNVY